MSRPALPRWLSSAPGQVAEGGSWPIPSLAGMPILGHALAAHSDLLGLLQRAAQQYPEAVRIPLGPRTLYLFHNLAILRQILVEQCTQFERGASHRVLRELLGEGLLTVDNDAWVDQRRAASVGLHPKRYSAVAATVAHYLPGLYATWDRAADRGEPRALYLDLMALCAQVSCRTFYDQDLSWAAAERFVHDFLLTMSLLYRRMRNPFSLPRADEREGRTRFCRFADALGRQGPHAGLAAQARTILATAPENPANTLAWSALLLCRNPAMLARAQQAAQRAEDGSGLLLNILRETLRLYPAVWGFERVARRALPLGSFELPAGALVLICPYTLHRLASYWPQPEEFRPDRFEMAEEDPRWAAWLPFSAGPRRCAGAPFMMAVAQAILPAILARYDLALHETEQGALIPVFTLRPTTGVLVRLTRRVGLIALSAGSSPTTLAERGPDGGSSGAGDAGS